MKKLVLVFSLFFMTSLMFAGNGDETNSKKTLVKKADGVTISVVESSSKKAESDALHCKVTCDNGDVYECWLCNCRNLPSCGGGAQQQ